jgi:hypothetical protein
MNKKTAQQFIFLLIIVILAACAKISTPSGGVRDRMAPVVLESDPQNGTVNFNSKEISITFDEFVVLDNINEKFMVSPPMKTKPRVFTRGKSVRVEYQDELRDSTTYTFYFMDAIRDLNEGNPIPDFRIAVSTGSFIDSLSVTGNVYMSPSLNIPESASILLYRNLNDSAAVKLFPDYLARIDEKGYFRIDNVRDGFYRLYALTDGDNSKNYNRREEPFGFIDSVIHVTPEKNFIPPAADTLKQSAAVIKKPVQEPVRVTRTTTSAAEKKTAPEIPEKMGEFRINMFAAERTARYLAGSSRPDSYRLMYFLSVPPDTMEVELTLEDADRDDYFIETTPYRDTITVWITDSSVYNRTLLTSVIQYPFTDTLGIHGYKKDTVNFRFAFPRAVRGTPRKRMLTLRNNIEGGNAKPGQKIIFNSETPLNVPDTSLIRLYEIIEKKSTSIPYNLQPDTSYSGRLVLAAKFLQGKEYLFIADSTSIGNIYGEHIDSTGIRFKVREASSYSKLTLDVSNTGGRTILELLDNSENLMARTIIENDTIVVFPLLEKGNYRLRAISDINKDGKYTTGDFSENRQPEPVTYFPKELEIPEGWDANEKWDIDVKNSKPQALRTVLKPQK